LFNRNFSVVLCVCSTAIEETVLAKQKKDTGDGTTSLDEDSPQEKKNALKRSQTKSKKKKKKSSKSKVSPAQNNGSDSD